MAKSTPKTPASSAGDLGKILHKKPDFRDSRLTLLIGNSMCGKTTMVRQFIVDSLKPPARYRKILLLCPTHHLNKDYDILPAEWKFKDYDLRGFYTRLKSIQESKFDPEKGEIPESERVLLILDDSIGTIAKGDVTLEEIAARARHYRIDVIIASQHMSGIASPIVRSNASLTIFGRMNDVNRDRVNKTLATMGKKAQAVDYVNKVFSDDYRFIVLSNQPKDRPLYTYKVDTDDIPKSLRIKLKSQQDTEIDELKPLPEK